MFPIDLGTIKIAYGQRLLSNHQKQHIVSDMWQAYNVIHSNLILIGWSVYNENSHFAFTKIRSKQSNSKFANSFPTFTSATQRETAFNKCSDSTMMRVDAIISNYMRRITWSISRGLWKPHIWNPWPHFAYSLFNFYGATMMIKGSLLVSVLVFDRTFCPTKFPK